MKKLLFNVFTLFIPTLYRFFVKKENVSLDDVLYLSSEILKVINDIIELIESTGGEKIDKDVKKVVALQNVMQLDSREAAIKMYVKYFAPGAVGKIVTSTKDEIDKYVGLIDELKQHVPDGTLVEAVKNEVTKNA